MANSKISELAAAATLTGTETLPVVQSGSTKKATISQVVAAIPSGTFVGNAERAALLDSLLTGAITRDPSTGALTAAAATWPDGATGAYAALVVSSAFPGSVDSYSVTHILGGITTTYTQPTVTRDTTTGAVTNRPAITVA